VVYLLLDAAVRDEAPPAVLLASLLAWAYFVRPLSAVSIAAVTAYIFFVYRDRFAAYAVTGAVWCAGFIVYSLVVFDRYLPAYYLRYSPGSGNLAAALLGVLASPSRGLFVYVPEVLFVSYLAVRYWRAMPERKLQILAIAIILVHTLVIARYEEWWGGKCYGARLYLDVLPWVVLLAILSLAGARSLSRARPGRIEIAAGLLTIALGIAVNAPALMKETPWDQTEAAQHVDRALDWSYPQFLAAYVGPKKWLTRRPRRSSLAEFDSSPRSSDR
jgi:hypothetical protein